jgi:hypothetical protein
MQLNCCIRMYKQTLVKKAEIDWVPSISCISWGEEARSQCMQTTWCVSKRGGKITQSMQTAMCSSKRGGKFILVCKQQHQETNSTCEEQRHHLTEESGRNTLVRLPGSHKTWTCWPGTSPLIRCGREWVQPRKFAQECGKEKLTVMDFDNQLPKNLIFVCSCPSGTSRSPRIRHGREIHKQKLAQSEVDHCKKHHQKTRVARLRCKTLLLMW